MRRWAAFVIVCLFVVCVSYASISVKIHGAVRRERKLTKTLFIMTLVSLLMWMPSPIFDLIIILATEIFPNFSITVFHRITLSLFVLFYENSLVKPIVYTFRMPEFKRALVSLFRRSVQQQGQVRVFPLRAI